MTTTHHHHDAMDGPSMANGHLTSYGLT